MPSACTIQVSEEIEHKIGRSHLIFESKSMGLLLRHVLEREYDIEVDFCDAVPMRESGQERDFCFSELDEIKTEIADENNNGTVRCTVDSNLHIWDEGGMFASETWKPIYGIMTNLGMFRYNRDTPMEILPKIMRLHGLSIQPVSGSYKGKRHVFILNYINDKEKPSQKYFSVDEPELYKVWTQKIREALQEYKKIGNRMIENPKRQAAKANVRQSVSTA